jgi:hypothetical protein
MAAEVTASASSFEAGAPKALFKAATLSQLGDLGPGGDQVYAVSADGQRFIFLTSIGQAEPITVVLNWTAALRN